jgi:ABC-type Fe3+-hydroxamate transport system substrate-binding protein
VYPDELRLVNDSNGYLSPVLFGDLGLTPYEYPGDPESISPELVGDLAADVVVLQPDFDGTDLLAQVVEQPLVQNLPAAQNDQLFVVDDPLAWQTWSAVGLKANTAFLQDFVALLAA